MAGRIRPGPARAPERRTGGARHAPGARAGAARSAAKPVPPTARQRPPGADPHLPQLVCRAAGHGAAGAAASPGPAHAIPIAGRRRRGRARSLAPVPAHRCRRRRPARGLHSRGGPAWPLANPQGAGCGAEPTRGVRPGRRGRRGPGLGAALCRAISRTGRCARPCLRAAGRRLPAALAGPRKSPGGREQQDPAKGGPGDHRGIRRHRRQPVPRQAAPGAVRGHGRPAGGKTGGNCPRPKGPPPAAAAQEAAPELRRLLDARRQHTAWQHQQSMARLTRCLSAQFAAVKNQHGWVDMNDVERSAQRMLADPVLSGWVQQRLDARIRHLLVDEFQDTNPLQWQGLPARLSGYAGAGGGAAPSVFIVGDPKQSIYRFRRAEPQVFMAAPTFVRNGLGGDLLSCDHTRRNATGVTAAVNQVMGQAQVQQEISGFRAHSTESQDPGAVLRLPAILPAPARDGADADPLAWRDSLTEPRHEPEETRRMRECAQAAAWVAAQIAAGTPPGQVLVLARKRDRLSAMQDALRALHLPCVQPEKADLFDAPEVQDLVALLDALVSTGHDLSLARALKSPLFGLGDEALAALARLPREPRPPACSWYELLQKRELLTGDLLAPGPVLAQYKAWVDAWPPHDALHAIYQHADVLARFAAAAPAAQRQAVQAQLRALLSAALQYDGGRYLTPYAFVRALKRGGLRAPGRVDAQAIRLLTVHGAKGLEAHCVLLLDTDTRPPKAETMGVLLDWPGERVVPASFIFLASEPQPPPSAEAALAAEQQARQREEMNF